MLSIYYFSAFQDCEVFKEQSGARKNRWKAVLLLLKKNVPNNTAFIKTLPFFLINFFLVQKKTLSTYQWDVYALDHVFLLLDENNEMAWLRGYES